VSPTDSDPESNCDFSWPSFLENTADYRRAHRRREYGDESDPRIREFLESISPINHAHKITAPLSIAHGETDVRVTVAEAIRMFEIVSKQGYVELMVCENEGHGMCILFVRQTWLIQVVGVGFKQKSVIEFTNVAKIRFLEKFLMSSDQ
jgi:Prolyl oligopeptidase family